MPRDDERQPQRRQAPVRLIAIAVALALLVWFGLANSQRVKVDFLVSDRQVRLVYALAVAALLGVVIGYFARRDER
jgi:uncharacterized integral membrane protein